MIHYSFLGDSALHCESEIFQRWEIAKGMLLFSSKEALLVKVRFKFLCVANFVTSDSFVASDS